MSLSLYDIENELQAIIDTDDGGVAPEHQEEFQQAVIAAHMAAVDKREKVHQFMVHLDSMTDSIDGEIQRLQARKKSLATGRSRIEDYVKSVILTLGKDEKGKYRKLQGSTCEFSLRKSPDVIKVDDDGILPDRFKSITITVPAEAWDAFCDSADIDERARLLAAVTSHSVAVNKRAIKEVLDAKQQVPGASLETDRYALQVK